MNFRTIRDINFKDKNVLVRVDFNVPMQGEAILSDLRIKSSLPTIEYSLEHGAKKIILLSHLGRPNGVETKELSLKPVCAHLQKLLPDTKIGFASLPKSLDDKIQDNSKIVLLENLRFNVGEEANSLDFAQKIISYTGAECFVQDGFAVVHRAHASTDAIAKLLPSYAGLLLEKELTTLSQLLENPSRPLSLIIGGAKVSDKSPLINKFLAVADHIIVGGKIAADGFDAYDPKIYVAEDFDEDATGTKLDVGPFSTAKILDLIKDSKTIIWNGLLGKAEDPAYATASTILAKYLGEAKDKNVIICGGDTAGFIEELQQKHTDLSYSFISTGGGAAIEFLSGKTLPGIIHFVI